MQTMQKLNSFFQSKAFVDFYQKFTVIGFWISIPICLFIVFLIVRMEKKYKARKKEIKKMIHAPGMEDVRWLFKSRLKKLDIEPDERAHEKN